MEKTSYSYKLKSHPNKTLKEHLENVLNIIVEEIEYKKLNINYSSDNIRNLVKVVALSHDFGKATAFFQEYLDNKKRTDKTNHSDISSLFAYFLAKKMNIEPGFLPYWVVRRHHGNLQDLESEKADDYSSLYSEKIDHLNIEELKRIFNELWPEANISEVLSNLKKTIKDDEFYDYIYESGDEIDGKIDNYFLINYIFSLLIDSDKLDAAIGKIETIKDLKNSIRNVSLPDAVDIHKTNQEFNADHPINNIRDKIYESAEKYLDHIDLEKKIYSLNVPTGTGKTFTGINFALKLKDLIYLKQKFNPKIIYCLPFTSIIDQNYSVIEDILYSNNINPTNEIILKHHHLSDLEYKAGDDTFDIDKSLLLTESWMSSIIITTFAQFFSSFISNRNRSLKKFHNMTNAIVILDEIQSIPYKYWTLINQTFKTFAQQYNTYFILVTATMPMIFKPDEIEEILPEKKIYFQSDHLNRITLTGDVEKRYLSDFIQDFSDELLNEYSDKSILAIFNTIKSSQVVFQHIHNLFEEDDNTSVLYLSTSILPVERQNIIKTIKDKDKRLIVISTQVVEAGVDIDLDVVYRDIAPLDSLFQAAGRCNRNAEGNEKGIVKLVNLCDKKTDKQYARYIYSETQLEATLKLFVEKESYSEKEFLNLAEEYYNNIVASQDKSYNYLEYICNLEYSKLGNFNLIDNQLIACDFYIELNDDAIDLMQQFNCIQEIRNPIERKNAFLKIRKDFYKYVISVRLKKDQKQYFEGNSQYEVVKNSLYCIPFAERENFYTSSGIGFNLGHLDDLESKGLIL